MNLQAPMSAQTPRPAEFGPVREHERIAVLDLLRGIALFGIFIVNMQLFAMTFSEWTAPAALDDGPPSRIACWALIKVFFEYKFISLFSLLFGAGLIVQMTRAKARGSPFAWVYVRRLIVLALIGLTHGLLLWYGDILFIYACLGAWLLLLRWIPPRVMLIIAAAIFSFGFVLYAGLATAGVVFGDFFEQLEAEMAEPSAAEQTESEQSVAEASDDSDDADQLAPSLEDGAADGDDATGDDSDDEAAPNDSATESESAETHAEVTGSETPDDQSSEGADATETADAKSIPAWLKSLESTSWCRAMNEAEWNMNSEKWKEAETQAFKHGPFIDALAFRAVLYGIAVLSAPFGYGWHVLAMFLIGAAFMRLGFFTTADMRWHKRLLAIGLIVGLPMEAAAALLQYLGLTRESWVQMTFSMALHDIGSVLLCLGLVGGVCQLARSESVIRRTAPIRAAGRMALTVYLSETIVSTALMYWWGFGWFGAVTRPQQIGLVILIYIGLMAFASLWLGPFRMGPIEWLWRTLTYWKLQPLRR